MPEQFSKSLEFPIGSIFVKQFSLNNKLIETRLFVHSQEQGWIGYSYEWNDLGDEAFLLSEAKDKTITDQVWH